MERLAALEVQVGVLLNGQQTIQTQLAALVLADQVRQGRDRSRSDLGVWVRWSPVILGVVLTMVNVAFLFADHLANAVP